MPNQWKPTPPLSQIEPLIRQLWAARLTDRQIVSELRKSIDGNQYGIGLTKFTEIRKELGLQRTRQQRHTKESIRATMMELRVIYPHAGAREMVSLLFHEHGMSVSRRVVQEYFHAYEPELVHKRKANRLRRRRFWAAGVNDIWAIDQHDKWLRFGLALHTGIEPFSGRILWMKVWHSNRNPQLILSYYLETAERLGHIPLVTQSDPGTENFGVANGQTMLRQILDPSLAGFIQHRWMRLKKNVMPEIAWSQLRRRFTPGFEAILQQGVDSGWYDPDNTLQLMIFRWLFIPWLQAELDRYQYRVNNTLKRRNRNKILPHGVPELIFQNPTNYGALDFKVPVNQAVIGSIRGLYINAAHPVFDLVPQRLNDFLVGCYDRLGNPALERGSIWSVYLNILSAARQYAEVPRILASLSSEEAVPEELELMSDQRDLPDNNGEYMGGVGNGYGLQQEHHHELDQLDVECEHAGVEPEDEMDVPPLIITAFSDDDSEDEDSAFIDM
ncbi:hypothetical protein JVU11DRAFT_7919 [Chiua virens]|nr:hypothetical protein JVU11DRAFT_7919 [Chiua virens]